MYKPPEEIRKGFPNELVKAFIEVSASDFEDEKIYKKYEKQAIEYLGNGGDSIDRGRLIVWLTKATADIMEKRKAKLKQVCKEHPKYKAMRFPRSGCKKCLAIYNVKKKTKKKKGKDKSKKDS